MRLVNTIQVNTPLIHDELRAKCRQTEHITQWCRVFCVCGWFSNLNIFTGCNLPLRM